MIKAKIKASFIHLVISALVVGTLLAYALTIWYPQPFAELAGLSNILLILLTVDLLLGPILTFFIFKPHRKNLKFDLAAIAALQIAALSYGMFTIYQGHPVYVAYAFGQFTPITAKEAEPEKVKYPELVSSTLGKPKLVYAKLPDKPGAAQELFKALMNGKPNLESRAEYYEPYANYKDKVIEQGFSPDKLFTSPQEKQELERFLAATPKANDSAADYAYLPLTGRQKDVIWALDKVTGLPVGILNINPWHQGELSAAK